MNRKLLTALVSACAIGAALTGAAAASASTLALNSSLGTPASVAAFGDAYADGRISVGGVHNYQCEEFTLSTEITQNEADPVTLEQNEGYVPSDIGDCFLTSQYDFDVSNVELTGPITLNADGTGELPLSFTETWDGPFGGPYSCEREGVLDIHYNANQGYGGTAVPFGGYMTSQTYCLVGYSSYVSGYLAAPKDEGADWIDWVVSP